MKVRTLLATRDVTPVCSFCITKGEKLINSCHSESTIRLFLHLLSLKRRDDEVATAESSKRSDTRRAVSAGLEDGAELWSKGVASGAASGKSL